MRKVLTGVAALALIGGGSLALAPKATAAPAQFTISTAQQGASVVVSVNGCSASENAEELLVYLVGADGNDVAAEIYHPLAQGANGAYAVALTPQGKSGPSSVGNYTVDAYCTYYDATSEQQEGVPASIKPYLEFAPTEFTTQTQVTMTGKLFTPGVAYKLVATFDSTGATTDLGTYTADEFGQLTWTGLLPYVAEGEYTLSVLAADGSVVTSAHYSYAAVDTDSTPAPVATDADTTGTGSTGSTGATSVAVAGNTGKPGVANTGINA